MTFYIVTKSEIEEKASEQIEELQTQTLDFLIINDIISEEFHNGKIFFHHDPYYSRLQI